MQIHNRRENQAEWEDFDFNIDRMNGGESLD